MAAARGLANRGGKRKKSENANDESKGRGLKNKTKKNEETSLFSRRRRSTFGFHLQALPSQSRCLLPPKTDDDFAACKNGTNIKLKQNEKTSKKEKLFLLSTLFSLCLSLRVAPASFFLHTAVPSLFYKGKIKAFAPPRRPARKERKRQRKRKRGLQKLPGSSPATLSSVHLASSLGTHSDTPPPLSQHASGLPCGDHATARAPEAAAAAEEEEPEGEGELASLLTRFPVLVSQTNSAPPPPLPPPPPPEAAAACLASGPSAAEHQTLVTTNSGSVIGGHGAAEERPGEEGPEEGPVAAAAVLGRSERASVTRSAESRPQVSSVAPSTLTETLVICAEWRCLTSETRLPDFGSLL